MDLESLRTDLLAFLKPSYPQIEVRVEPWRDDPTRLAIYFTDEKFALIYPMQRYHYLSHLIPKDYWEQHLANTVWFELAPGERPEDLRYPDEDLIESITPDVMKCVSAARVFEHLDDVLAPADPSRDRAACWGDYRHAKKVLLSRGFTEDELFDVLHVFMAQGGYCDCEILFNVADGSRLAAEYWTARAEGRTPRDPHDG